MPSAYDSTSLVALTPHYDTVNTDHSVCIPDDATPPNGNRPASCMCRIVPGDRGKGPGLSEAAGVTLRPMRNPLPRGEILYVTAGPMKAEIVHAEVFDARGGCVVRQDIGIIDGVGTVPIATSSLPAGTYTLLIRDGQSRITGRFVVE